MIEPSLLQLDRTCGILFYHQGQNLYKACRNLHYDFLIFRIDR